MCVELLFDKITSQVYFEIHFENYFEITSLSVFVVFSVLIALDNLRNVLDAISNFSEGFEKVSICFVNLLRSKSDSSGKVNKVDHYNVYGCFAWIYLPGRCT